MIHEHNGKKYVTGRCQFCNEIGCYACGLSCFDGLGYHPECTKKTEANIEK